MRTVVGFFGWLVGGVIVFVVGMALIFGTDALALSFYTPWAADKKTEITRNTNQYVTTQQTAISTLLGEYGKNEERLLTIEDPAVIQQIEDQQVRKVIDMCTAASRIDEQYVPSTAIALMEQQGCWTRAAKEHLHEA